MVTPQWQVLYIISIIITVFVMMLLLFYAVRLRHVTGARYFVGFMLPALLWTINIAVLALVVPENGLFWLNVKYLWIAIAPVALLLFALCFSNQEKWLTKRHMAAFLIIPIVTQIMVWTNPQHSLMIREVQFAQTGILTYLPPLTFGPYYWIHTGYSYILILLSAVLVIFTTIRGSYLHRGQGIFLALGILIPFLGNILLIADIAPREVDPMPFALLLSCLALGWSVFRYSLLDLAPVARNIFVDLMPNAMLAIDSRERIIDINRSMLERIDAKPQQVIGQPLTEVLKPWQKIVEDFRDDTDIVTEISIAERQFDLLIKPLTDRRGKVNGRIIVLHDISERKKMVEEREQLIESLQNALSEVKRLSGLLPICANCKKIRDDEGYWHDVAVYIRDHSEAEFSHSICPVCVEELYPAVAKKRREGKAKKE